MTPTRCRARSRAVSVGSGGTVTITVDAPGAPPSIIVTCAPSQSDVKKSALIGTENLPHVFYENFKSFSQRELPIFNTREEAMEWLVK